MSEAAGTSESEGHQPASQSAGSPVEGSGGGIPAGFVPQDQLEQAEARRRQTQSALDQERNRARSLEERLSGIESAMAKFDPAAVADQFSARFAQNQAIADARSKAKEQFPNARADVFDRQYQSPEELIQAAKSSHDESVAHDVAVAQRAEAALLERIKAEHGVSIAPTTPQTQPSEGEGGGTPPLDGKALASMDMKDFLNLPEDELRKALAR